MLKKIKSFFGLTRLPRGSNMLLLFLGIALALYAIFLRKVVPKVAQKLAPSPSLAINVIQEILQDAGYSPRMASYWVGVSDFETGYWTSSLYLNSYNMFGMKMPKVRPTTAIGSTASGFARYNSIQDSARDLVYYLNDWNYPKDFSSITEMVTFMKSKGYFEEPLEIYLKGVKSRI